MASDNGRADAAKALRKWSLRSQSASKLRAAIELAQSEPGIPARPDEFDRDLMRLNAANGVVNLATGELEPHRRDLYMTQIARTHYDPEAVCPQFLAFLRQNSGGRPELVDFKQRVYGSALTGSVQDQKVFIFHGSGANGKSTELSVIREILGDYAVQAASDTLIKRAAGAATNDIARLRGKRMVVANETESGDRLAAALIKQMTGGEAVTARKLYQEFTEIQPSWKIFLSTNNLPEIDGADPALLRRIDLVPFDVVIPEAERDPKLKEKLLEEAPGILTWMVRGALAWQSVGLREPACVRQAVEAYRVDSDPVGAWIEEACEHGNYETPARMLWERFLSWALGNGHGGITQSKFGRILGQKGFHTVKRGTTYRTGLRLKPARHH